MSFIDIIALSLLLVSMVESQIINVVKPKLVKESNNNVYLCSFPTNLNCQWKDLNNQPLIIDKFNYKYVTSDNGYNANNCSIKGPKEVIFDGNITCLGLVESKIVYVDIGSPVTLPCSSVNKVKCTWARNKSIIKTGKDYIFNDEPDGHDSCSITINSISGVDLGNWTCSTKVDDSNSEVIWLRSYRLLPRAAMTSKSTITAAQIGPTEIVTTENPDESSGELSLSLIIIIASTNVVLAGVIIGLVIFVCKHYNHQKQVSKAENNLNKELKNDRSIEEAYNRPVIRSSTVLPISSRPPTNNTSYETSEYYLVPIDEMESVSVHEIPKHKPKPVYNRSPNYMKHVYESVSS
ncbi:hypothetical protein CHUAL_003587 [Chamberlinius hualienensis]